MKKAVEGWRGESRRWGRYDNDGRHAGSRGTTSPYRHRNTDYKRRGRAGRPTAQCCPTFTAELNVSRTRATRPRGGGRRIVHAALACACRPALFLRTFFYFFLTFLLPSFDDGRPEYYTDIGYTGRRQTLPPPQRLDKKN
ncbi:unnamed protein product [Macrosiphum euphorbiae]|uniref:Uncharacterized protein n=1 Tax=Macrosiphum euphorbiae TaxID=13131 RepID=A0AAV0X5P4_9HEMI|nr:unnamed protein product [Macrosiphum euphorbiae]